MTDPRIVAPQMRQTAEQSVYSGAALLDVAEQELPNYHDWIVSKVIDAWGHECGARVMDFGSGRGALSTLFLDRTGVAPDGVEIDPELRYQYCDRGFRGYRVLADAPSDYDLIFSSNVLEHIEDDAAVLSELFAHLRPGGLLVLYLPAINLLWTTLDDMVGHYRRYTRHELESKLHVAGFQGVNTRYCDSIGFFLALLFKLLGSQNGEPSRVALRVFDRIILPFSKAGDLALSRVLGKNVFAVARRPSE